MASSGGGGTGGLGTMVLMQPDTNLLYSQYYGNLYYKANPYIPGGTGGGAAPPPASTPAPAAGPPVTSSTVSDLQVLIASIPIAQDGQVISAEYHNALRVALIAMANRLGLGIIAEEIFVTNAPRLVKGDTGNEWTPEVGGVKKKNEDTGTLRGWMELDLPDGARIKKMQVFAANDSAGTMKVKLRRQSVSSSAGDDLIAIAVANNDATTAKEGDVTLPESTLASAIEAARIVDNRKYKYLFVAELDGGVTGKEARVLTLQVVLGK